MVSLKEVLPNYQMTLEGEVGLCPGCSQHGIKTANNIVGQLKEHFEELLNPTGSSSIEEAQLEGSGKPFSFHQPRSLK